MDQRVIVCKVIDALEAASVPYMVVGSLSSNVFGIVRSTKDADIVMELGDRRVSEVTSLLGSEFHLQQQITFESITGTTRHIIDVQDSPFKIELFRLSSDPHDIERFHRRREYKAAQLDRLVFLPTPEDIIITKLRWAISSDRYKDRDDVRNVIAVQAEDLDWLYIHRWCDEHGTRQLLNEIRGTIPPI